MLSVGLLPVIFTLISKDGLSRYGLRRTGLVKSLVLSAVVIVASHAFSYLNTGRLIDVASLDTSPPFPWNIWYALLGMFAYGPLEVFFVIWLMATTGGCSRANVPASHGA